MAQNLDILATTKVNAVMQTLVDQRTLPQRLVALSRTPIVPCTDGEITAYYEGYAYLADIIADNAKAVVRDTGKFTFDTFKVPNIKHGTAVDQERLNLLDRINRGGGIPSDNGIISNWRSRIVDNLLLGIRNRMEMLLWAMKLDAFSVDGLGIKASGTWGMPSDLKVNADDWATTNSGTPVDDIDTLVQLAADKYGAVYTRLTMSRAAFRLLVATDEFKAKAQLYSSFTFPTGSWPSQLDKPMLQYAQNILGMDIELHDWTYPTESADATVTTTNRFLANNYVILDNPADDNSDAFDWGNGVVTESLVADELSGMFGGLGGAQYGPVAYTTPSAIDLNPPGYTVWAVTRGFPRKHNKACSAYIRVKSTAI